MYRLDATELLVAEVVALRAALKRLIVEEAVRRPDPGTWLAEGFERAAEDVAVGLGEDGDGERDAAIVEHAQEILREIYTVTLAIE